MIAVYSHSEAGGHAENEDAFVIEQHPSDSACWICTVADGQGGRAGGGRAARIAAQLVPELAKRQPPSSLMENRSWEGLLGAADKLVAKDSIAGFTTLIGFCVHDDRIVGAANGDSAVAVFDVMRDGWGPTKNPPVGSGDATIMTFATDLEPPWMVLAMSDGVWKYSRWDRIIEVGKKLRGQAVIDTLLDSARLMRTRQLQDDFTIVVLQSDR